MTTTKNTTAAERRIRHRAGLAAYLGSYCDTLQKKGFETKVLRAIVTELHIGNTEIVLGEPWESDTKAVEADTKPPSGDTKPAETGANRLSTNSPADGANDNQPAQEAADRQPLQEGFVTLPPGVRFERLSPVIRFGRREVVVRCARKGDDYVIEMFGVPSGCEGAPLGCLLEIPDNQQPLCTLVFKTEEQAMRVFDAMQADTPQVTEAMVDRAVDGWQQWWNGFTGPVGRQAHLDAMAYALQQALGVRS